MTVAQPRSGYTLPVFACAAAIAALRHSQNPVSGFHSVQVHLIEPDTVAEIPVEQVATLPSGMTLAMTRSDPGDNLDITHNTPIWAVVEHRHSEGEEPLRIQGGEGIGKIMAAGGKAAIYFYAERLFQANLNPLLAPNEQITVTIILPEGKALAERTSNTAFGVVEGLSLLGSTGISQPLSALGQLELFREDLQAKVSQSQDPLVFCIGENGLDFAQRMGFSPQQLVKTANWLGPLLVEAGLQQAPSILLFGYHGKLIKLAGGIFHTHHYLADGRLEILTAHCANLGLPPAVLKQVFASPTTEAALEILREIDVMEGSTWVKEVYQAIATAVDHRAQEYIFRHTQQTVTVGSILFGRDRQILAISSNATAWIP